MLKYGENNRDGVDCCSTHYPDPHYTEAGFHITIKNWRSGKHFNESLHIFNLKAALPLATSHGCKYTGPTSIVVIKRVY